MMGIDEKPGIKGKEVIPVERHGVKVISMAFFVEENAPVIWRGPMLGKMLTNFFTEVKWGDIEYLILESSTWNRRCSFRCSYDVTFK